MASYISCPVAPPHFPLLWFKVQDKFKIDLKDKGYHLALHFPRLIQYAAVETGY